MVEITAVLIFFIPIVFGPRVDILSWIMWLPMDFPKFLYHIFQIRMNRFPKQNTTVLCSDFGSVPIYGLPDFCQFRQKSDVLAKIVPRFCGNLF